jgi:hypothetical protein
MLPNQNNWYDIILGMFFGGVIGLYFVLKANEFGEWFESNLK